MAQYNFFATKNDLLPILEEFEKKSPVKYLLMHGDGWDRRSDTQDWPVYRCASEIEDLSTVDPEYGDDHRRFALIYPSRDIILHTNETIDGQVTVANAMDYDEGFVLTPGGLRPDRVMIEGSLVTSFWNDETKNQFNSLRRVFRKHFRTKHDNFWWIGPEAYELLKAGYRFTRSIGSSSELDLTIPK